MPAPRSGVPGVATPAAGPNEFPLVASPRAPSVRRRALAALALAAALPACRPAGPSFRSTDVTGAEFGRDFALLDPDGRTRRLADFRGKFVMMFFGYVQCPDVCPTALSRAVAVREKLGADGARLQVIFMTVDPERDTPTILRAYAAAFSPDFLGLYGDLPTTQATAKAFRVFYQKVPNGASYTVDHTATTYVFDDAGRLRLAVPHAMSADDLAADLRTLMGAGG
ncbi:MAG: SCO family protein [Burkholderiaceae bacterium]